MSSLMKSPGSAPALLVGRWIYSDESSDVSDGTILEFKSSAEYGKVEASFLIQEEGIVAKMDCTVTADGIIVEETGSEISNRYEGNLSEDGSSITGKWLCTKSSMTGDDATREGDAGSFELSRDTKDCLPWSESVKLFTGRWVYSDQSTDEAYTEEEGEGTIIEIAKGDDGSMVASFLFDEVLPCGCKFTKNGKGVAIEERGEDISNDYIGFISEDGNTVSGWWTTTASNTESAAAGDSGEFKLTREVSKN